VARLTLASLRLALQRERRTSQRLRRVIEDVEHAIADNRRDLDLQFSRIAQLQAEVDRLKKVAQAGVLGSTATQSFSDQAES